MKNAARHKMNGANGATPAWLGLNSKRSRRKLKKNLPADNQKPTRPRKTRRQLMLADLARSGLTERDAKRLGFKPMSGDRAKKKLKLRLISLPDGYGIPNFDAEGNRIPGAFRWRALGEYTQRNRQTRKDEPGPKYRQPAGSDVRIYFCPFVDWQEVEGAVVITEGEKKSACACKFGIPTIGLGGVWNWKVPKSDDELLPEFDEVLYEGVNVELCFDSDVETNPNVRLALARFAAALEKRGCDVRVVYLPSGPDGQKIGLDDFLVAAGGKANGSFSRKRARRAFTKLPRHAPPEIEPLTIRCAADITPKSLWPLWPDVLYRRKVALVAGDPGLGKSLVTCDIAARVSTASDWPGGVSAVADPAPVVMISGEDDPDDTIVPRLIAAGADLSRVHIIDDVVEKRDGELSVLSIDAHMATIDRAVRRCNAALLIIDPISPFMGNSDSHKDTSVRALLNKVRRYAIEGEYAVLLITHFNKPGEKINLAIHRVMGSLGFVAAARSVFAFVRDPKDRELRLFLPIKNNLGPDTEGFRCHVEVDRTQNLSPPPVYLQWDDEPPKGEHIDAVLAQPSPREQARKAKEQEISKWLDGFMKRGKKVRSTKFNAAVQEQGFSAKKVTEIMVKFGYKKGQKKFHGKWWVTRDKRTDGQDARL